MRISKRVVIVLGLTFCTGVHAASKISGEVLGVRLGATLAEVRKVHPGGVVEDDFYTVRNFSSTYKLVAFGFTRTGTLYRVHRCYADGYVRKLAGGDLAEGMKQLTDMLLEEYGPAQPMHRSGRGTALDPLVLSVVWNHEPDHLLALKIVGCEGSLEAGLILVNTSIGREAAEKPGVQADFAFPGGNDEILGVRFGATLDAVKRRYPKGILHESCWVVQYPAQQYELACFWFTPARTMYLVSLVYADDFLKAAGRGSLEEGIDALVAHLAQTRGPCDRMSNGGRGTAEDPTTYACDWDPKDRGHAMQLKIIREKDPSVVLILECAPAKGETERRASPAASRWF